MDERLLSFVVHFDSAGFAVIFSLFCSIYQPLCLSRLFTAAKYF